MNAFHSQASQVALPLLLQRHVHDCDPWQVLLALVPFGQVTEQLPAYALGTAVAKATPASALLNERIAVLRGKSLVVACGRDCLAAYAIKCASQRTVAITATDAAKKVAISGAERAFAIAVAAELNAATAKDLLMHCGQIPSLLRTSRRTKLVGFIFKSVLVTRRRPGYSQSLGRRKSVVPGGALTRSAAGENNSFVIPSATRA